MTDGLRLDLQRAIEGEVRFDASRARSIPPTPASIRSSRSASSFRARERTSSAPSRSRGRHGVSDHRARRRHVAGRPGDRRRPRRRHLEVLQPHPRGERRRALGARRAGHRARRAERAAQAARPSLRARYLHREPRHDRRHDRATTRAARDRCSTARRSITCSSRTSCSPTAHRRTCGRSTPRELDAACAGDTLEARVLSHRPPDRARVTPDEIERRFPKVLRRVGGYNLDEFIDPATAVQPREAHRRLRRHARRGRARRRSTSCRCRRRKPCWRSSSTICSTRSAATPLDPAAQAVGGRGDGPVHPRPRAREPGARRACADRSCRRRSGRAAVRRVLRRPRGRSAAAARGARARSSTPAVRRTATRRATRRADAGAHLELPRSGARAVDGDEGRRQVALVRRRHGRRARAAARLHRRFLQIVRAHGTHRRRLRARVGRLPARAAGRQPEDRRRRRSVRGDRHATSPISCSNSAARCRASTATAWCAARSWRRCSGRRSTRRSATIKRTFDPHGIFNPGKIVDAPPLTANLRFGAGYQTPDPPTYFDYSEYGGFGARGRDVQRPRRVPQDARRHDVPVLHGDARREATPRAAAPTCCGWRMAGRLGEAGLGDDGVLRGARSVPRMPGVQGRMSGRRGRGAVQERVPRRLLAAARHAARARGCSGTSMRCRRWGSRLAPLSNWLAAQRASARWLGERLFGIDRRRTLPRVDAATRSHRRFAASRRLAAWRTARASCSSTTRSRTTTIRRSASRRSTCSTRPASPSASRRTSAAAGR